MDIGACGESKVSKGDRGGDGDSKNTGADGKGGGSGDEARKGPRFPRVLLSGYEQGIYWINTSRPLARRLLDDPQYGSSSPRWREYLFQRYVEIILKQAIYELGKHDPEITPDKIDGLIDDVTSRVHDAAAEDLEDFLFGENLTGMAPPPPSESEIGTSLSTEA